MENRDFFLIPRVIIDSGLWAAMCPAERSVYLVLCHYRNYKTNICFPSIRTICKNSGYHKNTVCKVLQQLVLYGLIEKKRAPQGLRFKNIYTIFLNPNLDPSFFPSKSEKKYKPRMRNEKGKFKASPINPETGTFPPKSESGSTINMEKKLSKFEIGGNRDSKKPLPFTISLKTLKALKEEKGEEWVKKQLKSRKYTIEGDSSPKEEDIRVPNE